MENETCTKNHGEASVVNCFRSHGSRTDTTLAEGLILAAPGHSTDSLLSLWTRSEHPGLPLSTLPWIPPAAVPHIVEDAAPFASLQVSQRVPDDAAKLLTALRVLVQPRP